MAVNLLRLGSVHLSDLRPTAFELPGEEIWHTSDEGVPIREIKNGKTSIFEVRGICEWLTSLPSAKAAIRELKKADTREYQRMLRMQKMTDWGSQTVVQKSVKKKKRVLPCSTSTEKASVGTLPPISDCGEWLHQERQEPNPNSQEVSPAFRCKRTRGQPVARSLAGRCPWRACRTWRRGFYLCSWRSRGNSTDPEARI